MIKAQLQQEMWSALKHSPDITLDDMRAMLDAMKPDSNGFTVCQN